MVQWNSLNKSLRVQQLVFIHIPTPPQTIANSGSSRRSYSHIGCICCSINGQLVVLEDYGLIERYCSSKTANVRSCCACATPGAKRNGTELGAMGSCPLHNCLFRNTKKCILSCSLYSWHCDICYIVVNVENFG